MRLGVFCDFSYRADEQGVSAEFPFSLFVEGLAPHFERVVVFGRLDRAPGRFPFRLRSTHLVALPHYGSGADFGKVLRSVPAAMRAYWRALTDLDVVWLLGPNPPHVLLFALLGMLRGRRVVLGVRQNLPELIRHRRPGRPAVLLSAYALEWAFRALGLWLPVVVVGPDIASRYRHARRLLNIYVSLLQRGDVIAAADDPRGYGGEELVMLSVGRLDPEKNPLLMADVLALALKSDPRWRLHVCGDGTLSEALVDRCAQLGIADRLVLHGYVPIDGGLWSFYRSAHALLHVSMSEGVPQVILEAFAARLPIVATAVGGVAGVLDGRGLLVEPGDAPAAAAALTRLAHDDTLRRQLTDAGAAAAADHTLESEAARVAGFLSMNS